MRSVYIHIPFCKSICSYCDFCKFYYNDSWANDYLDHLEKEIDEYYENDEVKTIYIGGGSPSSLSIDNLNKLFNIIKKLNYKNGEFTFECNINDINEELLMILKENKVNRLSIGVESFNKKNLEFLNRKHTKNEIFKNIELCKKYEFDNINVDIIYALPVESFHTLKQDILNILKLDIEHISTYSLIIEENTILYNKHVKCIEEELDYKMYSYICKKLKKKGYNHYEVSNFAKDGYESVHNSNYWFNREYYGFGLGAHGYINNIRYENTRNFNKYLKDEYRLNELLVSNQEEIENELILGLRRLEGINTIEFEKKFHRSIFDVFKLDEAIKNKYLIYKNDYIFIPENKIYVMNEIINMIM